MRTKVGIVGAGPAGLMLSHLLHLNGIDSIVIENRSRDYIVHRIRAGLMEQWAADMMVETGIGERLQREAMVHGGNYLCFDGTAHHLNFRKLVGKGVVIYGQQEVVKDLVDKRLADGGQVLFEVEDTAIHDFHTDKPFITFRHEGKAQRIDCDFIAGCDGFHGVCRPSFPSGALTFYDREYPFGWLGVLSEAPPPDEELIYAYHPNGFALYSMRSPTLGRLYLQVDHDEDVNNWPDDRVWEQLHVRLGGTRKLPEGRVLQKGVTAMRSFVCEPMQSGRLFLAGDSAHIVPPTGAKGMNLALADVKMLSRAIETFYKTGATERLERYSETCLKRVWKAQRFSWWMTQSYHIFPGELPFDHRRQLAELDYLAHSVAAQTSLAEQYTGLPFEDEPGAW